MASADLPPVGAITWTDLTVPDADRLRDFYAAVAGWTPEPLDMGGYADYVMSRPGDGTAVAGVCHARGSNLGLPAQWLIYITVADLDRSIARCRELGGEVLLGPRAMGAGRFCVVRDPAGAVAALAQP